MTHLYLKDTWFKSMICRVLYTKMKRCCSTGELSAFDEIDILPEFTLRADAYTHHSS